MTQWSGVYHKLKKCISNVITYISMRDPENKQRGTYKKRFKLKRLHQHIQVKKLLPDILENSQRISIYQIHNALKSMKNNKTTRRE